MNNLEVEKILKDCKDELDGLEKIRNALGSMQPVMRVINLYALIKVCGTLEMAYKMIIADHCDTGQNEQVKKFISNKVRDSSKNPSYASMCQLLNDFDLSWKKEFKKRIKTHPNSERLFDSLESLNEARNEFAHGGSPSISFNYINSYFSDGRIFIEILDDVVK